MDRNSLLRLANDGIARFPPADLQTLADWCWDYGEATGDARYCSLWRCLDLLAERFAQFEALAAEDVSFYDGLLRACMADILDASESALAASLARQLREQMFEV